MLFTLQATAVSEALETVAAKVSVSPRNAVQLLGVMLMVMMEGGVGGGGVTEPDSDHYLDKACKSNVLRFTKLRASPGGKLK